MKSFNDILLSIVLAMGTAVAIWRGFAQLDKTINPNVRKSFSEKILAAISSPISGLVIDWRSVFEKLFGTSQLSTLCWWRTLQIATIACSALTALWAVKHPSQFVAFYSNLHLKHVFEACAFLVVCAVVPVFLSILTLRLMLRNVSRETQVSLVARFFLLALIQIVLMTVFFQAFFRHGILGLVVNGILCFIAGEVLLVCCGSFGLIAFVISLALPTFAMKFASQSEEGSQTTDTSKMNQRTCFTYVCYVFVFACISVPYASRIGWQFGKYACDSLSLGPYKASWLDCLHQVAQYFGLHGGFGTWLVLFCTYMISSIVVAIVAVGFHLLFGLDMERNKEAVKAIREVPGYSLLATAACLGMPVVFGSNTLPVLDLYSLDDYGNPFRQNVADRIASALALDSERTGLATVGIVLYPQFLATIAFLMVVLVEIAIRIGSLVPNAAIRFCKALDFEENPFSSFGFIIGLAFLLVVGIAASIAKHPTEETGYTFRNWTDTTGRYRVTARLIDADNRSVILKLQSGQIVRVMKQTLCETDRAFVDRHLDPE